MPILTTLFLLQKNILVFLLLQEAFCNRSVVLYDSKKRNLISDCFFNRSEIHRLEYLLGFWCQGGADIQGLVLFDIFVGLQSPASTMLYRLWIAYSDMMPRASKWDYLRLPNHFIYGRSLIGLIANLASLVSRFHIFSPSWHCIHGDNAEIRWSLESWHPSVTV